MRKSNILAAVLMLISAAVLGAESMDYSIVWVRGHVEVFDWAGRFCFSADSEREALEELEQVA